jgi:RHS repeat-associated protein
MRGSNMIASSSGSTWSNNIYANGMLLAQVIGSTSYYYQNDALGSARLVTSSTGSVLYSSNYEPFGASFDPSGSFTPEFQFDGKMVDYASTGLYYYGARFYDPSIDRFVTEDSSKGNLEDPLSLDRYIYARDNPEAITDPTGHDWFSSFTSAVSNAVSTASSDIGTVSQAISSGVNTVSSTIEALPSDASSAWNSLPPQQQAEVVTVAVDVGAAIAIGASGGSLLLTPAGDGLVGAAISTTTYTLMEGSNANAGGALGAAISGGISGATGGAAAGMGIFLGSAVSAAGSAGGDILGSIVTSEVSGRPISFNRQQILTDAIISFATFGIAKYSGDYIGSMIGSDVGRPATRMNTLWEGFLSPSDHPRAAYQVYSGIVGLGFTIGSHFGSQFLTDRDL